MAFNEKKLQKFIEKYFNNPLAFSKLLKIEPENQDFCMETKKPQKKSKDKYASDEFLDTIGTLLSPVISTPVIRGIMPNLNKSDLEQRVKQAVEAQSFSDYLIYLSNLKKMDSVDIYKNALVDRKTFSKIKSDQDYHPKKLTALQLCIGLKLNMDESKDLLRHAGYSFSEASKTDVIFAFFIENKNYDIYAIDEALFKFEEPTISKY